MDVRRSGLASVAGADSVPNYSYWATPIRVPQLRRSVSTPNVTTIINPFDTSAQRYGGSTKVYIDKRRYGQHWDRWDDYVVDRRYDYINPKYWAYYGSEPYRPWSYRSMESNDYYWKKYYLPAIHTPKATRADYISTYHTRTYTEPYYSKHYYFYHPYKPWAY